MSEALAALVVTSLILIVAYASSMLGGIHAREQTMQEAFDRGHAVQCVGKAGYYWECEE